MVEELVEQTRNRGPNGILMLGQHERAKRRSILMSGDFVASRISFPEWPQVPQGTVRSNTGNSQLYLLDLWGTAVTIPVKYRRAERDRQIVSVREIRECRELSTQILNAVAEHLSMPDIMTENIRLNCIEVYDMTRPPSNKCSTVRVILEISIWVIA